jgi:RNA polymerase sigma-B factor
MLLPTSTHLVQPDGFERQQLADRTHDLMVRAQTADPVERQLIIDQVVVSHLWLAESVSRRFLRRGEDPEDLVQVARAALVEAGQRFDPEQGSFIGFAIPTMTGMLKRHFRDHGWLVRPPRRSQELASVIWRQWPAMVQRLAAVPSDSDVAGQLGEPVAAVIQAHLASRGYRSASIDVALARGVWIAGSETEDEIDRIEARMIVDRVLPELDEDELRLIELRFYEQLSQSEIAKLLGTSQMQVSRLLSRLMVKLRDLVGTDDSLSAAS